MAKKKTSWRHLHKHVIHENRWLAWTIAIAILVCSALIGYIQVSEIHFQNQMAEVYYSTATWRTFEHPAGFSFKYPRNWGVESEGNSTISFVSPTDADDYFSITTYPLSQEKEIRASLFMTKEEPVTVSGLKAVKISQSRSQPESVVMVKEGNQLLVLRGKGFVFERMLETVKFTEKLERI
jgi:hypothetical protein